MTGWTFKPKAPGETIRDPIHGEFFATDAISNPGMALVREGIQNSLDAGLPGELVRVRLFLAGPEHGAPPAEIGAYFDGARPHLEAPDNGLRRDDLPEPEAPCPFLVFEDFGTRGLEGDPKEAFRSKSGERNHFYHFFRAEGQTDKDPSQRGSWGVGKHVFWRASRVSAVFGYTVRASDRARLLMSKAVLKCHWLGDRYYQDGYFGAAHPEQRHFIMPIRDAAVIEPFRKAFRLARDREPGLSIVVPWPDVDITDQALLESVLYGYFYPILTGQLHVTIATPQRETSLDQDSLIPEVRRNGGRTAEELGALLELAQWARSLPDGKRALLRKPDRSRAWRWDASLIPEALLDELRDRFERLEALALRVPVTVREKGKAPAESFYDVFMTRDLSDTAGRPTFIREGVIIPKVDAPRSRGVRALVVIDDRPLTGFLRDAENPSHTEWQHDGSNFRGKYKSGRSDLTFIKRTVHEIVRLLTETETKADKALLADFFSLPRLGSLQTPEQRPGQNSGTEPATPVSLMSRPVPFRLQRVQGGFALLPGEGPVKPQSLFEVRVAYDMRRGNPLKKYRTSDFKLGEPPIRFEPPPQGLEVVEYQDNRVVVEVLNPDFRLHICGFDVHRDLYVRIDSREGFLADTTS